MLKRHSLDEQTGRAACWALNNLAADGGCRMSLLKAGAGRAILARDPSLARDETRRAGCWALHNLCACDEARLSLHADGAGDAAIAILRGY